MEERREIVYELAKRSNGGAEMLQTWSRQDILQILCSEMGKERKYTGLTKLKIIEQLLRVVSEKISTNHNNEVHHEQQSLTSISPKCQKKPRKPDNPTHFPISDTECSKENDTGFATYCKNSSCKARMSKEDKFCKRCTCCICHKYDDNKDPSLWLTCSSEPPFVGDSCNMSCHLECAIKHGRSGIARNGLVPRLDGSFYCISCGKMNDLMSCWRKQVVMAKETRRVDILCYRISLSQKLLRGTKKYEKPCEIVEDAIKLLKEEVGPLSGVALKMGRGIVNRLSSGQQVQRFCASALDVFDSMFSQSPLHLGIDTSSLGVCNDDIAKCSMLERIQSPATNCSTLSNPSSMEDETSNDLNEKKGENYFNSGNDRNPSCASDEENATGKFESSDQSDPEKANLENSLNGQPGEEGNESNELPEKTNTPYVGPETSLPITPSWKESLKDGSNKTGPPKSHKTGRDQETEEENPRQASKKRIPERETEECLGDDPSSESNNLEYYIKVIRWLECDGHINKNFRQKFLTWYGIRATPQETRIVKAFVDTLIDDPVSLSEQLRDTFEEIISSKRSEHNSPGFCLKLWH